MSYSRGHNHHNKMPDHFPRYSPQNVLSQNFAFPKTLIFYCFDRKCKTLLGKHPKYLVKIYALCKYFFKKIRIIPCHEIYDEREYVIVSYGSYSEKPLQIENTKISYQLCKKMDWHFCPAIGITTDSKTPYFRPPKRLSNLIPRICNNKVFMLYIQNRKLTLPEYIILTSNEKCNITLMNSYVFKETETGSKEIVPVEDLLKASPNIGAFKYHCNRNNAVNLCSPSTAQILAGMPRFRNLYFFTLYNVPHSFDAPSFAEFMMKNFYRKSPFLRGLRDHRFSLLFIDNDSVNVAATIRNFKTITEAAVSSIKIDGMQLHCLIDSM